MNFKEELTNPGLTATFIVSIKNVTSDVFKGSLNVDNSEQIIAENILKIQNAANEATGYKNVIKPFYC